MLSPSFEIHESRLVWKPKYMLIKTNVEWLLITLHKKMTKAEYHQKLFMIIRSKGYVKIIKWLRNLFNSFLPVYLKHVFIGNVKYGIYMFDKLALTLINNWKI